MRQCSFFDNPPGGHAPEPPTALEQAAQVPVKVATEIAFDVEATGRDPLSDRIVGIALCREKGKACYVPIRHTDGPNLPDGLEILKSVFDNATIGKIGHNLKYDILLLRAEGIAVQGALFDTMIAAYLLNPNKPNHSLEDAGLEYLLYKKRPFIDVLGKRTSFGDVPAEEATAYAAEDAALAFELRHVLFDRLNSEGLASLYFDIEMPLISVLCDLEEAGIRVDRARLNDLSKELESELSRIESRIYGLAGEQFNINSPKQLGAILFERLGLAPRRKTKTGYSTSMEVLEELSEFHELPSEVLNYRTLFKLKSTYVDALPRLINERTGRVHTSFNQTVTATGRLSSSEPNLQNIPVRGDWGNKIREAVIADSGCLLVSADYSQIELRVLAHVSGDPMLVKAFRTGIDVHTTTAAALFNVAEGAVTSDMRRVAKTVNFGVIYGISPFGLSEALSIQPKEAAYFIDQYFMRHEGVRHYIDLTLDSARRDGFVTTLLGRKRPIPDIRNPNMAVRQQAERMAMNSPIQGTAADLIKIAMINVSHRLREGKYRAKMVLQIHDELLLEVPEAELAAVKDLVTYEMEHALELTVPLKVDAGIGLNWAAAH